MFLALEEAPFVLQGPKPTIPPAAWESYWGSGLIALGLIALAVVALRQFLRKGPPSLAPLAQLDVALRLAESEDAPAAIAKATRALRVYLAATDARAAVSLSTEELVTVLAGLPVFLPARQPLLAALRSADAAKFAGASLEVSLLIAGIREAAKRIEDAQRTFARPIATPVLPPKPRPAALDTPPPLPGPPPLPRRDHA
ncbi:MAG: hypothetical protein RLZZ23_529 [Verrucomicrobiota bacterium]|jgi:hypothetical protein